jgi:uncharacterized membrane protein YcaP (DUF421 family)
VNALVTVAALFPALDRLLGLGLRADELTFAHMAARTFVVFLFAIALMRVGEERMLGKNAGFDVMLGVILGSVLSRGINGQAAFYPTLGASLVLVLIHRLVAWASLYSHLVSLFAKGRERVLVRDGRIDQAELRRAMMTKDDLLENLRLHGNVNDFAQVQEARLERNGTVSVVKRKTQ